MKNPSISTYDKDDFYKNWSRINSNLGERWDNVVKNSPHKELKEATLTDKYFVSSITKQLAKWLPNKKGLKILKYDLYNEATMTSTLAEWFLARKYDYYGVDISKEVVRLAKINFAKKIDIKHFKVGDVRSLPFKENTFDIVFSFGTIEHIREHEQSVSEAYRVLKPGGIFISGVNNKLDLWLTYLVNELSNKLFKHITSYEPSHYPWEQRSWLKQAGFKNITTTGMITFPHLVRYTDLFIEWKHITGLPKYFWNNLLIKPLIALATFTDKIDIIRLFAMHTTSLGYKPKSNQKRKNRSIG